MSGTGLCPSAVPTARTAFGRPISAAIQPYGRTSPRGISSALCQTSRSKSVWPRRSRSIRTRRSPPSRRAMAVASRSGSRSARMARPAGPGEVGRLEGGVVGDRLDGGHAQPVPGHHERPDRGVEPGVAVHQPDLGEDARGERGRARGSRGRPWLPPGRDRRWSCGHLLALAPLGGLERRAQQGQAAMDLRLDGALGSIEGGGELRVGQAVDVAQHDRAAIRRRQGQQQLGPVGGRGAGRARRRPVRGPRPSEARGRPAAGRRATPNGGRWPVAGSVASGTG